MSARASERYSFLLRLLQTAAGIALGYGLSLLTSLGWFLWTHHTPTDPASRAYIAATAVFSALFALLGGALAVGIARRPAAGDAVATLILLLTLYAIAETRSVAAGHHALWYLYVTALCVAPAAALGGRLAGRRI